LKTFTDNGGRTWTVSLNVTTLKQVKSLCGVDLMDAVNDGGKLLERLASDPVLLCDVIFAICKDQAEAKSVTDVDFGGGMAGDPIESATTALLEELVDFFPRGKREVLRRALQKMRTYEEKFLKAAHLKLDDPRMDDAVEKRIAGFLSSTPGDSSGSAPGS
jgi:hypothetical protein